MKKEFYGDFKETDMILTEVLMSLKKDFGLLVEPENYYQGDTIKFTISDGKLE